jgi:DNA-binding winged helix-turn-helix (wHTH) protein
VLAFPPFRLDLDEERLWKGNKLLVLRRKPFAILRYLATNPRRLVTHDELLKQVWAGAVVSESAVRSRLHELRQALGDGVIETVIGRGYRFTAGIAADAAAIAAYREANARAVARHMWLFAMRAGTRLAGLAPDGAATRSEARAWIIEALARCAEPASNATDFAEARAVLADL